jgi:hypothetical protein
MLRIIVVTVVGGFLVCIVMFQWILVLWVFVKITPAVSIRSHQPDSPAFVHPSLRVSSAFLEAFYQLID